MLSLSKIKEFKKLSQKKYRHQFSQFIVEGEKMVRELVINSISAPYVFVLTEALKNEFSQHPLFESVELISEQTMKQLSQFNTNSSALAIVPTDSLPTLSLNHLSFPLLALDFIQDPGNLGTIIRTADWFGFNGILCSHNTVDRFNHKVVQASMGAIFRMPMLYVDLPQILTDIPVPTYGTFLAGKDIYNTPLPQQGVYIIGNEANGISKEIESLVSNRLTIPNFSSKTIKTESLNAAISTAIVCSEVAQNK